MELRWRQCDVADVLPRFRRRHARVVAVEPDVDVEEVDLLRPEHPGKRLALHDASRRRCALRRMDRRRRTRRPRRGAARQICVDVVQRLRRAVSGVEPQAQTRRDSPGRDRHSVVHARLRSDLRGIHRVLAVDDVAMKGVLHVRRCDCAPRRRPLGVGLVVGEERRRRRRQLEMALAQAICERQIRAAQLRCESSATNASVPGRAPQRIGGSAARLASTPRCCETRGAG